MSKKNLQITPRTRSFNIREGSVDVESREFDIVFSTGAEVVRQPFFDEPYIEELSLDPQHVRLDRLKNKAPFLNSHKSSNLEDVIGVVRSARVDGKKGDARIKFSDRESVRSILKDVTDGILNHVSVGYRVHTFRDVTEPEDKYRRLRAIDWEPFEISLVPVGADDKAVFRAEESTKNSCEIILSEERIMSKPNVNVEQKKETKVEKKVETILETVNEDIETAKREGSEAERTRTAGIMHACRKAGFDSEYAAKLIEENVSLDQARAKIIDKLADENDVGKEIDSTNVTLGRNIGKQSFVEGCTNAILHRAFPDKVKIEEVGREFRMQGLLDMLRFHVERVEGRNSWELGPDELIRAAFHSTSDFPNILQNVANKSLLMGYNQKPQTFLPFVKRKERKDFKPNSNLRFGPAPELEQLNEGGEIKFGTIAESNEIYQLLSFAKKVQVTRRVIINDDLGVFTELPYKFGLSSQRKESDLVYAQITDTTLQMNDGLALFHANHNNLAGSGSVIDVGSISDAETAIGLQRDIDDSTELELEGAILLVPTGLKSRARQYVEDLGGSALSPSQPSNTNPHIGKFTVISDPRLHRNSATAWYMLADKGSIDMIELGYLQGQENGPSLIQQIIPGEGVVFGAYFDRAAKAMDFRGFYKNPGA